MVPHSYYPGYFLTMCHKLPLLNDPKDEIFTTLLTALHRNAAYITAGIFQHHVLMIMYFEFNKPTFQSSIVYSYRANKTFTLQKASVFFYCSGTF